jgi:nucleotide-binding universal stress UspA family protein
MKPQRDVKTVLAGTSLDRESDHVVQIALALARRHGASLELVHATDLPPVYDGLAAGDVHAAMVDDARRELAAQAARLAAGSGVPWRCHVRDGAAHRVLAELAGELQAGLLVVGRRRRAHGPSLGSTADRLIRRAACPVLVVDDGMKLPFARILLTVDLSPVAAEAAREGLALLRRGSPVPLAVEALFVLDPVERGARVHFTGAQVDRFAREELHRFLSGVAHEGGVREAVRTGYPDREIVAEAEAWGADLVVLGTHGRGGFARLLLGSVAAEVLRRAPSSVLVVPHAAMLDEAAGQCADWVHVADVAREPAEASL